MKIARIKICLAAILFFCQVAAFSQSDEPIPKTQKLVREIIERSYPELKNAKIEIKTFESNSNYFKSQFSVSRFLSFRKISYVLFVNAEVFRRNAPDDGISAILAHELAHILYYQRKNRFQLLGLAALADKSFTAKFERRADLEAIMRGYAEGLKSYREWLYLNIPPNAVGAKKRNYFSPVEIDAMVLLLKEKPDLIDFWRKRVPRNLNDISVAKQ